MKTSKKKTPPPADPLLEGEIPTYEQAGLDDDFAAMVVKKLKLAEKKKAIEDEEDEIKSQLLALVEATGHKRIQVGDARVIYSEGASRSKLDPKLLLKNGVSAAVIAKSTVDTPGKPYVMVTMTRGGE